MITILLVGIAFCLAVMTVYPAIYVRGMAVSRRYYGLLRLTGCVGFCYLALAIAPRLGVHVNAGIDTYHVRKILAAITACLAFTLVLMKPDRSEPNSRK